MTKQNREGHDDNTSVDKHYLNWTTKAFDVIIYIIIEDPQMNMEGRDVYKVNTVSATPLWYKNSF